jgi:hypothetical protein
MGRKHKLNGNSSSTPEKARRRVTPIAVVVVLTVVVAACLGFLWLKSRHPGASVPAPSTAQSKPTSQPAGAVASTSGFEKLKGEWLRPDGGYTIEVRNIDDGGKMDALYFNPKSINVHKAEASRDGAITKVFIELRDANYPGSTYDLAYDAQKDLLTGIYYHAGLRQSFDVIFRRMR